MIREHIKYKFNQIEIGITGCVACIEAQLQELVEDLPVFIMQTGDTNYYWERKWLETDNKDIIQKVPRVVLDIEDVQFLNDQNTNQYNKIYYMFEDKEYLTVGRRMALQIPISLNFVSSNLLKAFEHLEVIATIISKPNVFTYEFLGNTFEGSFMSTGNSTEKPNMDVSSATRNVNLKLQMELNLQIWVPRIASIISADEVIDGVSFHITALAKTPKDLDYHTQLEKNTNE